MPRAPSGPTLFWRLFLSSAGVVLAVLGMVLVVVSLSARRTADASIGRALDATRRHVSAVLDGRERGLASGALVFAQDPSFRSLVIAQHPADLLDQALEAVQRTGASWVQITDGRGVRLARSDDPSAPPVALHETGLVSGALAGALTTGVGVTGDSAIFQGVAAPVMLGSGVAGVLMAAAPMDAALARSIQEVTESDVLIYLLAEGGAPHVVAATLPAGAPLAQIAADHARSAARGDGREWARIEEEIHGERYVGQGQLLRSASGEALGGVVTLRSRAVAMAPFSALRRRIAVTGALGLVLACALAWGVARHVTRPILALTDAARRARAGDYSAATRLEHASGEIGALAEAVRSVLSGVREQHTVAEFLADARVASGAGATRGEGAPGAAPELATADLTGPLVPGRVLAGRYEIEALLGLGGSGAVYRARDRELDELVAIKTLRPAALAVGATAIERFKDEIRLARRISHANVVRIHDLGEAHGTYFITMEYVAGQSLQDVLDQVERLPVRVVAALGAQLCEALEVAHAQGVIHRDVKPQNLMLHPDGVLKVMDFGIARLAERAAGTTLAGTVVGTPSYMAPEQLLGEQLDARADVYAAGVVLYECLTGRLPHDAGSPRSLLGRLLTESAPAPHELRPDVPRALSEAVLRALARDPNDRPQSAAELHALLTQAMLAPAPPRPSGGVRPPTAPAEPAALV